MTMYTVTQLLLVTIGAVAGFLYLVIHRPTRLLSSANVNADGWVPLLLAWYVRSLTLLLWRGNASYQGIGDAFFATGSLVLFDVLFILRLISYLRFRAEFNRAHQDQKEE